MNWDDDGIVLSARKHGESAVIVQLLTRHHGRHAGLVRGGAGSRARGLYQPGNRVRAAWRGRLAEHLGTYVCELVAAPAADWLDDGDRLAALASLTAIAETALAEREPHPRLYDGLAAAIAGFGSDDWLGNVVRWELDLLADLGFGLDLSSCAATGATDKLIYVSPRSGRAVSETAGTPYKERLLELPPFLAAGGPADAAQAIKGLRLTGRFLADHVFAALDRELPPARTRFVDRLARLATISSDS